VTSPPAAEALLTLADVARLLRLHPASARRLIHAEGLPAVRLGRRLRVSATELRAWLAARRVGAGVA
jgi:excisionase family DNA binding protein